MENLSPTRLNFQPPETDLIRRRDTKKDKLQAEGTGLLKRLAADLYYVSIYDTKTLQAKYLQSFI